MKATAFNWLSALYVAPALLDCFTKATLWAHISYVQLWLAIGEGVISVLVYLAFCMASKEKEGLITRLGTKIYLFLSPCSGVIRFNIFWRIVFITAMVLTCVNNQWNCSLVAFLLITLWNCWPTPSVQSVKAKLR